MKKQAANWAYHFISLGIFTAAIALIALISVADHLATGSKR